MDPSNYTVLLVDDEPDILEFVSYNLKKEGYKVYTASNGKEGVALAEKHKPNLVLLDVMMPGMDGIETCDIMRSIPELKNVIIAFLTARGEDYSQVAGFDAGADDYITKPIKPKVLLSRLKALLRRAGGESSSNSEHSLDQGKLVIDKEKYQVIFNGNVLDLPRKEFELISLLSSKPGKVFPRDEIMDRIWGNDVVVGGRTIDVHIRKIREKIGDKSIKTIKGVGYKFDEQA
jgi:two-component system alkaline phosphatase synthesis response regulator PhoP